MDRKDLLVYDVPAVIRENLLASAEIENISINETAVRILAEHYVVGGIEPSGVPFTGDHGGKNLAIRTGKNLHRRISIDAAKRGGTLRGVVLETLALHYGLEPEPIGRRPRRSTKGEHSE